MLTMNGYETVKINVSIALKFKCIKTLRIVAVLLMLSTPVPRI